MLVVLATASVTTFAHRGEPEPESDADASPAAEPSAQEKREPAS